MLKPYEFTMMLREEAHDLYLLYLPHGAKGRMFLNGKGFAIQESKMAMEHPFFIL